MEPNTGALLPLEPVVISPSVNDSTLTSLQPFTIYATVKNQGSGSSASTTLRYYRSTNSTISTGDTPIGTDGVTSLSPGGTSPENILVSAPTGGTYWVGACVDAVSGESSTANQCSTGVQITVTTSPDLVIDFGSYGTFVYYNDSTWFKLHSLNPNHIATGDLDGIGGDEVIIGFLGYGTYVYYNNGTWVKLHSLSPDNDAGVVAGNIDGN